MTSGRSCPQARFPAAPRPPSEGGRFAFATTIPAAGNATVAASTRAATRSADRSANRARSWASPLSVRSRKVPRCSPSTASRTASRSPAMARAAAPARSRSSTGTRSSSVGPVPSAFARNVPARPRDQLAGPEVAQLEHQPISVAAGVERDADCTQFERSIGTGDCRSRRRTRQRKPERHLGRRRPDLRREIQPRQRHHSLAVGNGDFPLVDRYRHTRRVACQPIRKWPERSVRSCAGCDPRFENGPFDTDRGRTHLPGKQGQPRDRDVEGGDPPADRAGDANRDAGERHARTRKELERSRLVGRLDRLPPVRTGVRRRVSRHRYPPATGRGR